MEISHTPQEILKILKSSRLFKQFEDEQLTTLISLSKIETFKKGEVILPESVLNDKVFVLLEGKLAVHAEDEFILTLRRQGDIFGEMSVITKSITTATVYADSPVELFSMSSSKLIKSGEYALRSMIFKIFLDILIEKLTLTTNRVKGFQATSEELSIKKQELVQKTVILQSVLGSMSDGVVVTDSTGKLLHVNEAFTQMISRNTVPRSFKDWPKELGLFHSDKKTLYQKEELPMLRLLKNQIVDSEEIFVQNKKLQHGVWLLANGSLLKSEGSSEYEGAVVVFRDYTKKKLEEEALIRAKEHAEAIANSKTNFLSVISHELRTPLNGIIGMVDLMKTTQLTEEQNDYFETICESSDSLLSIVKNILIFNDLESGILKLKSDSYIVKALINEVMDQYVPNAQLKNVTVDIVCDEMFDKPVLGDRKRVLQVLEYIINNAVKFTKQGNITITAKSEITVAENIFFKIAIKDTGIGITADDQKNLFQAFSQVDTSFKRQFEGTGMGLVIAKKIITLIGGDIIVESQEGIGSTFTIQFQQKISDSVIDNNGLYGVEKVKKIKKPALDHSILKGELPKILVAEDNKVNQKLIGKVLKKLGYEAIIAKHGKEAVEFFKKEPYKIILMDLQMPEMDGLEATENILKISSKNNTTPNIIALTANITEGVKEQCLEVGMCDYMSKPLRMDKLSAILKKYQ